MKTGTESSSFIKKLAAELGFQSCGISKAEKLLEEESRLEYWLSKGYHGKMSYMTGNFEKRLDPTLLVEGCKSVISLSFNYFPEENVDSTDLRISKYAYGEDYHFVIKDYLRLMLNRMQEKLGDFNARVFVDSAPVMERSWAARSGLGWIGKHSLLLNRTAGSFFFLAEIMLDLELPADAPVTDHCGTCTACIDACPTDAIIDSKLVDSTKCISYLTIELKDEIPASYQGDMQGWIFGCDICQDVCPWNRFSKPHSTASFQMNDELKGLHTKGWQELTEEVFKRIFKKSAVKRAGYIKLKKSIEFCDRE